MTVMGVRISLSVSTVKTAGYLSASPSLVCSKSRQRPISYLVTYLALPRAHRGKKDT